MKPIWIIEARYEEEFQIIIKFNDGTEGIVDLKDKLKGAIFEPLKKEEYFKNFKLNTWTIEWPNGADFAPEFLHNLVQKTQMVN